MNRFYSHGKLLLTGEYVVLDGALSLALPSKYGQSLEVQLSGQSGLIWKSFDHRNNIWYDESFEITNNELLGTLTDPVSTRLMNILNSVETLKPGFLSSISGSEVQSHMEFPNNWGLGSSSTLINNIANWAGIDAYQLLEHTFGGSGYDLACANADGPLTYKIVQVNYEGSSNTFREIKKVVFDPPFKDHLYFIHLNQKQDSRQGIAQYMKYRANVEGVIKEIDQITESFVSCEQLEDFQKLILKHETLISKVTNQIPVKEKHFPDFKGSIKSLGAWGGDFILVASEDNPMTYFKTKGFSTILKFTDMVL